MPRPYCLQVTSRPNAVSEDVWRQWYTEERIRELVYSGVTHTSAVYRASGDSITANIEALETSNDDSSGGEETTFLALYQSAHSNVLQACAAPDLKCKVRVHSELFGEGKTCYDVGTFKPLDLQLVEVLGSYAHCEDVAPCLLYHFIAGEEVESKIQFDHVNAVARLEGYRRTLLYRPVDATRFGAKDIGPYVVLVHEFDKEVEVERLKGVMGSLEGIETTKGCVFWLQAYGLIESEGFDGNCRTPERMER